MTAKKFSQLLYDKYDQAGKQALINWFEAKGFTCVEDPESKIGPDLLVTTPQGKSFYVDPEVRIKWTRGDFPFPTIHIPERKGKFLKYKKHPLFFATLRNDLKVALFIPSHLLTHIVLKENRNRFKESGEYFFPVPRKKAALRRLT